ncbi:MAG: type I-U CRISPR-associated helicase/endonuclease Cas3 [Gordonia sp. (in: high G+C Gram-positive bacteria)]|uniref:type I-G CRISPR-associated helicase/endonuclease Cas3g n=1 Tax=Gordonia sp. (in: high G+C Gram-positive bacteria) TaxID=84139 RepID=UPI0039E54EF9
MIGFPSFTEFFHSATGNEPFAWQSALADRIRTEGRWPGAIDVPTGLGKTSCIHVAVYELARQLHTGESRTAPLRIHHVIDRNTVVAQSYSDVHDLAAAINEPSDEHLRAVHDALALALSPYEAGPVVGFARYDGTLRVGDPQRVHGCSITSMSAHQFMSRILFRGFGVGAKNRSIDAGLAGVDSLVLFDEPHLSEPSLTALSDIVDLQSRSLDLGIPRLQVTMLGATRRPALGADLVHPDRGEFAFVSDDRANVRVHAERSITLSEVSSKSDTAFAKRIATHVRELRTADPDASIGVVVNTIAMAHGVARLVRKAGFPVRVITSRMRPLDRVSIAETALDARGSIIVSTQCIEVGMDLSFDHLVTEACPMPSFRQRVGRLNRFGDSRSAGSGYLVFGRAKGADIVRAGTAAVYGEEPVRETVAALRDLSGHDGIVDASVHAQRSWPNHEEFWPRRDRHATLTSAVVPFLTMTSPTLPSDFPVDAFITGPDAKPRSDVRVAWRADIGLVPDCPPLDGESVGVPIGDVRRLLNGHRDRTDDLSDSGAGGEDVRVRPGSTAPGFLIRSGGSEWGGLANLSPGCEVVIDASDGGYTPEDGWDPESRRPVPDVSAIAALATANDPRPRSFPITEKALAALVAVRWVDTGFAEEFRRRIADPDGFDPQTRKDLRSDFNAALADAETQGSSRARLDDIVESDDGPLIARITSSTNNRTVHGRVQSLDEHLSQVAMWAGADASAIGLPDDLTEQITAAGYGHDEGKRADVWQRLANRGLIPESAIAKYSYQVPRGRWRALADAFGFPPGWRHEALSYLLAVQRGESPLTCHLIAAHHGWFRPFAPPLKHLLDATVDLPDAERLCQRYGADYADRFDELNVTYGPWGLAHLEAVLRLADRRASEYPSESVDTEHVPTELTPLDSSTRPSVLPFDTVSGDEVPLTGLTVSPTAGWFTVVGLLGFAESQGVSASACWRAMSAGDDRPALPVIRLDADLDDLVRALWESDLITTADDLTRARLGQDLFAKSHKLGSVENVRDLLKQADTGSPLITGVVNDAAPAAAKLELAMPVAANNSSFGSVTAAALAKPSSAGLAALLDPAEGFVEANFDGGLDRSPTIRPLVDGLGDHGRRQSRGLLTPFILHAFAALGTPPTAGYGVAHRTLTLPLPGRFTTLAALRALTLIGDQESGGRWDWASIDCGWMLHGSFLQPTDYEKFWDLEFVRRTGPR